MERFITRLPPEMGPPPGAGAGARLLGVAAQCGAIALIVVAWLALSIMPPGIVERAAARVAHAGLSRAGSDLLREVWAIVNDRFYDPDLNGVDPSAAIADFADAADDAATPAELRGVVNDSLAMLEASHTRLFTPDESAFYEVLDVFNPNGLAAGQVPGQPEGAVAYVGIGCVTKQIEGRAFVSDVYPTGPADDCGLRVGDEIVSVDGAAWGPVEPFAGRAGQAVELVVRRTPGMRALRLEVTPERIRPRQMYLRALRASASVTDHDGRRLAYVRIRSYAHESYHDALVELMGDEFAGADGLVLDLRGGWGGAVARYTDAFNPAHPYMQMRGRGGEWGTVSRVWDRPLVVLIDEGTRSGKEMVADALQRAGVATLVGTPTAGAVLGGSAFPLSDGSLLMVAVTDVRLDGRTLEGNPVQPDVLVERPLPYCNGADPQLDAGYEALLERIGAGRPL